MNPIDFNHIDWTLKHYTVQLAKWISVRKISIRDINHVANLYNVMCEGPINTVKIDGILESFILLVTKLWVTFRLYHSSKFQINGLFNGLLLDQQLINFLLINTLFCLRFFLCCLMPI